MLHIAQIVNMVVCNLKVLLMHRGTLKLFSKMLDRRVHLDLSMLVQDDDSL